MKIAENVNCNIQVVMELAVDRIVQHIRVIGRSEHLPG
jgi:hypothetical protein